MAQSELQTAFVLHSRPYRNSSLLVDLFTQKHGRVSVVARSARGLKSRFKGILQCFTPLMVAYVGKHELKTLTQAELNAAPLRLQGVSLTAAFYLNELLYKLLAKYDEHRDLFDAYQHTLSALTQGEHLQQHLRYFEWQLLTELGYAPRLTVCIDGVALCADRYYALVPEHGLQRCESNDGYCGAHLLALNSHALQDQAALQTAKRLTRALLHYYLDGKPIVAREMLGA